MCSLAFNKKLKENSSGMEGRRRGIVKQKKHMKNSKQYARIEYIFR